MHRAQSLPDRRQADQPRGPFTVGSGQGSQGIAQALLPFDTAEQPFLIVLEQAQQRL
ncbi:hypothetical protein D3C85_1850260 [compost metagenome]